MAARNYFSHTTRRRLVHRPHQGRALRAPANTRWGVGENLAWGTGPLATPAAIVTPGCAARSHRANVLKRAFREVGVGVGINGAKVVYTRTSAPH